MQNPMCDGAGPCSKNSTVKLLPYSKDGNIILCRSCYLREMDWRRERNRELGKDCQFALPDWYTLKTYGEAIQEKATR